MCERRSTMYRGSICGDIKGYLFVIVVYFVSCCFVFFFQQKTAYEMRIRGWSSDVCSSDLEIKHRVDALGPALDHLGHLARPPREVKAQAQRMKMAEGRDRQFARRILPDSLEDDVAQIVEQHPGETRTRIGEHQPDQIGRASVRERVCQYV